MKKICAVFVLFCVVFLLGCSGSKNDTKYSNSNESKSNKDSGETLDSDASDSGDTAIPDVTDTGETVGETRISECTGLPENAIWNIVSTIIQSWNGTEWTPSSVGTYDEATSNSECRFKCEDNYGWNGSKCVDKTPENIKNLAEEYINFAHGVGVVIGYGTDKFTSFAHGYLDIATKEPLKTDKLFEIGSITKSFTAVTILKLVEEEKLKLEDTIDKWFPDFEKGDKITVKMLLNHTSGIREMTEILEPDQVVENVKGRFNFEPGKGWADTNSDYIMAGLIIEQVTGKKAHEVIREKIIDPLELKNTFMKGYEEYPKAKEVKGHNYKPDGSIENYIFDSKTWMAGAMVSNAEDLFKYADAFFCGKILKEESLKLMLTPVNETTPYGLGVQISNGTYILAGNTSTAKYIAQSHSLVTFYPKNRMKQIVLNNFPDNKGLLALNDEIEQILNNNIKFEKPNDFPNWDKLIDHKETTQIFALYSSFSNDFDHNIGYFVYPGDTLRNYYCKHSIKQQENILGKEELVVIQDCQEPKEYLDPKGNYTNQRTEIYVNSQDFKEAVESKEPTSKFKVAKYDYYVENGFAYKACLYFEDDGNEANKKATILQDSDTYRIWGKATMKESEQGCHCFEENEYDGEIEMIECQEEE